MSKQQSDDEEIATSVLAGHGRHGSGEVTVLQDPNDPDSVIIRTRKRVRKHAHRTKKRKMSPGVRALVVVLGVVLGLATAVGISLAIAVYMGNMNLHKVLEDKGEAIGNTAAKASNDGQLVEYKGHTYEYNKDVVSFVLIGHDDEQLAGYEGRSLADTIVLFTFNTANNKVRATVVPRNTWCGVDLFDENGNYTTTRDMQITLSHGVNLPTTGECAQNTVRSVSRLMYNMPMTYYVDFGREVVSNAATAVGGVQVEALETIPGTEIVEGETYLLDGDLAYQYVSYREKDKDESALDRQERQAQFIRAFAAKVAGMGVPGILDVYNGISADLVTNLGISEVSYLASCFVLGDNAELEVAQLKGKTKVGLEADGEEYEQYHLNKDSVLQNTLAAYYTQKD